MKVIAQTTAHCGDINAIQLFGEGGYYATASSDKQIRIWQVTSGLEMVTLAGHYNRVTDLWVNPDRSRLYSCSEDKSLRIWDLASGLEQAVLRGHENRLLALAVTPDERWAATAGRDGLVKIWDLSQREEKPRYTLQGHQGWVTTLLLDQRDGTLLSGGRDGTVQRWEIASGRSLGRVVAEPLPMMTAPLRQTPNGEFLVAGSDGTIRVLGEGKTWRIAGHGDWVTAMVLNQSATHLYSASRSGELRCWELATGSLEWELQLEQAIGAMAWLRDGRMLVGDCKGQLHWIA